MIHVVDGTFELFRFHYAPRPVHRSRTGQNVKATVGMLEGLLSLLESGDGVSTEPATYVAVAFDNPIRSFRNDLFDGYKTEEGMDPELRAQFDLAEEAVAALGIRVWSMKDFEADDALASAAQAFQTHSPVRILSPDKDLAQCVVGDRVVCVDRIRKKQTDASGVKARFGVEPQAIPDFLGLVGDTADGIPGLPGFGEKTTSTLLTAFGSLEQIPNEPSTWPKLRGADRLAETLASRRSDASLYKRLATLRTDAPIDRKAEDLRYAGLAGFEAVCHQLGTPRILQRAQRIAAAL